jgi:hypothetical protein
VFKYESDASLDKGSRLPEQAIEISSNGVLGSVFLLRFAGPPPTADNESANLTASRRRRP